MTGDPRPMDDMANMADMMSKMMGGEGEMGMPSMDMMSRMMPQGLGMMLSLPAPEHTNPLELLGDVRQVERDGERLNEALQVPPVGGLPESCQVTREGPTGAIASSPRAL